MADDEGYARRRLVQAAELTARLALQAVIAEQVAMVAHVDDERVVQQAQVLCVIHQVTNPRVAHGDLACIERANVVQLLGRHIVT